jgi:arylsulfatase A-like enzyme
MRPIKNILILTTDHHRFDAFSPYHPGLCYTPNLDRLAQTSVRFDHCYCQSPVCQPARFSIASGLYVGAHGVVFNESGPPRPDFRTIGHALAPHGYRRFNVGHMHWSNTEGDVLVPFDTGFEPWITRARWRETQTDDVLSRFDWENQRTTRLTTGGPSSRTRDQYWGYHVATETMRQISEAVEQNEPFLAWASIWEPHPPFYPPKDCYEGVDQNLISLSTSGSSRSDSTIERFEQRRKRWAHLTDVELRQMIAGYYGMVALADEYVGMILDNLDELGVRDETLIIFTSDHGEQLWDHELFLKFVFYEQSVHVPLFFSHPSFVPSVRSELVEHVDLVPTICDLLSIDPPGRVNGRSLKPELYNESDGDDHPEKVVFSEIWNNTMIRTREHKLNFHGDEPEELYDLRLDPGEFENRIQDLAYDAVIADLVERTANWRQSLSM